MADPLPDPDLTRVPHARLGNMFPHDAPNSRWLYRLAVLHDDLRFELNGLLFNPGVPDIDAAWRVSYFLRKISISIGEARDIWVAHVGAFLKEHHPASRDQLLKGGELLVQTAEKLRPVRDAVGAHVRPSNAKPKDEKGEAAADTFERNALRDFADWSGPAQMSTRVLDSTYRGLTMTSTMFPVGLRDLEALNKWHTDLRLVECSMTILGTIDALIYADMVARAELKQKIEHSKQAGALLPDEG